MRRLCYATAMLIVIGGCDRPEQRVAIHDNVGQHKICVTKESIEQTVVDDGVSADEAAGILARRSIKKQRIITNLEQDLADYAHEHGEGHFEERVRLLQTKCSLSREEAIAQMLDMPAFVELEQE